MIWYPAIALVILFACLVFGLAYNVYILPPLLRLGFDALSFSQILYWLVSTESGRILCVVVVFAVLIWFGLGMLNNTIKGGGRRSSASPSGSGTVQIPFIPKTQRAVRVLRVKKDQITIGLASEYTSQHKKLGVIQTYAVQGKILEIISGHLCHGDFSNGDQRITIQLDYSSLDVQKAVDALETYFNELDVRAQEQVDIMFDHTKTGSGSADWKYVS